jgi:hypothetical protein
MLTKPSFRVYPRPFVSSQYLYRVLPFYVLLPYPTRGLQAVSFSLIFYDKILCAVLTTLMSVTHYIHLILV